MKDKHPFKDLQAWRSSRDLVRVIYEATATLPREERFGLTAQLRRAVVSVPSNIAEGAGRNTIKDSLQFQYVARGSLNEVETQLYLAQDLQLIGEAAAVVLVERVEESRRILSGYIRYLENQL